MTDIVFSVNEQLIEVLIFAFSRFWGTFYSFFIVSYRKFDFLEKDRIKTLQLQVNNKLEKKKEKRNKENKSQNKKEEKEEKTNNKAKTKIKQKMGIFH